MLKIKVPISVECVTYAMLLACLSQVVPRVQCQTNFYRTKSPNSEYLLNTIVAVFYSTATKIICQDMNFAVHNKNVYACIMERGLV